MRYSLSVTHHYDDYERPSSLHRIAGLPIGVRSEDWPRHNGRPMQHAFTIDLENLELDVPAAADARALAVFVDSFHELDTESSDGIAVVWLSQAQIDAVPESTPPNDFVLEPRTESGRSGGGGDDGDGDGDEYGDEYDEGGYGEESDDNGEIEVEVEAIDDEDEPSFGDSYIGGQPTWSDAGEPEQRPAGAFVLQVMSWDFPLCRRNACMFVFERGAYLQAEYPDDDEAPVPWPDAIAQSRELIVLDQPPEPDALQKWGGMARGVSSYDWPAGATHILTWIPETKPDDMEAVALALFGRLSKTSNWDDELSFYQVIEIGESDLEEWSADDVEIPDGVELLPERAIELRPFPEGTSWRDLQTRSFVGPRPAWRAPERRSARSTHKDTVLQLTDELLPVSPGRGTLHAIGTYYPIWHPEAGAPQATSERYVPSGTLYEEETTAAIVVGWRLSFDDFQVLPERVEQLERNLMAALATRGVDLRLYVPGDTTTDRNSQVQGSYVLGEAVVVTGANDYEPSHIEPSRITDALARLPALDEAFWREALGFVGGIEPPDAPSAYLLSWGPLCYGAIYVGVASSRDNEQVYAFVANQDMSQEWSSEGIDGVHVEGVEFTDIQDLMGEDGNLLDSSKLAAVDKLEQPGFWLICRYD